ncbi:hypothetical protein, partial [Methylobacterium haplocladii]|uniref:hypothetical protein n=1 Tax=Methylobacterium haplocladii TaxID=1176176 RepID=UPI001AEDE166
MARESVCLTGEDLPKARRRIGTPKSRRREVGKHRVIAGLVAPVKGEQCREDQDDVTGWLWTGLIERI